MCAVLAACLHGCRLKARSISTGLQVWSLQLKPVSAPAAAPGAVAVVTPAGLQASSGRRQPPPWAMRCHLPCSLLTRLCMLIAPRPLPCPLQPAGCSLD